MAVQTPPPPAPTPQAETDAGVIDDARARQRRHRRAGAILVATALAAGALVAGLAGGGGDNGTAGNAHDGPSGSPAAPHGSASRAFPGAPSTQPNGYGVASRVCPLAPANRYLPARSGCLTVMRADIDGGGRPDLVLVYSRLSRQHPSWYAPGTAPPGLRHEYVAEAAFLRVVLDDGVRVTARLPQTVAAAVDGIAHVNDDPGSEIFLEVGRISSGASGLAYGYEHGSLVPAGVTLAYGGDSGTKAGFDCLPGRPPRLIQRTFTLIGGAMINGPWRETDVIYAWHGPRLRRVSQSTFTRRGAVSAGESGIGRGCTKGIA